MNNKYFSGSHLTERKFCEILACFSNDFSATTAAQMTQVSRPTINKLYTAFRERIVAISTRPVYPKIGSFELDESYFGARRKRGIRGRGAQGKTIVFGILERGGNVYVYVVPDCSEAALLPLIQRHIDPRSVIYRDGFKTYDVLPKYGYRHLLQVNHADNEFAKKNGSTTITTNGIENFWSICKVRLAKFRGMHKNTFNLHLQECAFRYNNKGKNANKNIYKLLLKEFRLYPLNLS